MCLSLTLRDRRDAYARTFARYPASHLWIVEEQGREVLYGIWLLGNDYRNKTRYYGAYPPGFLDRVMALYPDVDGAARPYDVLQAFSGSLPAGPYVRCDLWQEAEFRCRIEDLPKLWPHSEPGGHAYSLVIADPPYSAADAERYGTAMVDRRRVMAALAQVTRVGSHLVWLDCVWPMHRNIEWQTVGRLFLDEEPEPVDVGAVEPEKDWQTVGRVGLVRSTNHRVRLISIFERVAA